jgi:hypothetical protein
MQWAFTKTTHGLGRPLQVIHINPFAFTKITHCCAAAVYASVHKNETPSTAMLATVPTR